MQRKRSRLINKEVLMAEFNDTISSPTLDKSKQPTSFPRLFTGFSFKNFSEATEVVMSPTSILDSKPFSSLKKPFWSDSNPTLKSPEPETKRHWNNLDSKAIGLAIVDSLNDGDKPETDVLKPESRMVVFGSQLKIQIPPLVASVISPVESPKSPADFGIKTKNSQLGSFSSGMSHSPVKKSVFGSDNSGMNTPTSPGVFTGSLSASEMELSEDYTCVILHGPNPTTTHIFHNCIIESCCGVVDDSVSKKHNHGFFSDGLSYPPDDFLSFCYACKKNLGQGEDIYMYRGEKAFCSSECRYQEIVLEEGIDI